MPPPNVSINSDTNDMLLAEEVSRVNGPSGAWDSQLMSLARLAKVERTAPGLAATASIRRECHWLIGLVLCFQELR